MQEKNKKPEQIIKIVEGDYRCYIHYKVNSTIKETSQYKVIKQNIPIESILENLHLSLSKPFYLSYNYVKPFIDKLKSRINKFECTNIPLVFDKWILLNKFLVLTTRQPSKSKLMKNLQYVNSTMEAFGFEKYYEPPIIHVSLFIVKSEELSQIDLSKYPAPKTMTVLKELCLGVGEKVITIW